ncbi:hypothetical protein [Acetobacter papayae]|uniref:hypothetical protein n=1 Tax=Acetobacter papayae TaxID=1076592 RepID=UPI001F15EEB6|nr:hypothetical protein [Acetobacter papayae]
MNTCAPSLAEYPDPIMKILHSLLKSVVWYGVVLYLFIDSRRRPKPDTATENGRSSLSGTTAALTRAD